MDERRFPPTAVRGWRSTPPNVTRALFAVVDGARTVRGVARELDVAVGTAHALLVTLRQEGLVGWELHKAATLRPLARQVWFQEQLPAW